MPMEKLFHPYMSDMNLESRDPAMLYLCSNILLSLGWSAQQGMIDQAFEYLRLLANHAPEEFLKGCSNGLGLIQDELKKTSPEIYADMFCIVKKHDIIRTL